MKQLTLGEVAKWGSGGTPKRSVKEYFGPGYPWLSIADLNDGVVIDSKESITPAGLQNSSAKLVPAGTIFVAMYGSIGKLGIAGQEMCTSQAIAYAVPDPKVVNTRFLFHYLLSQRTALLDRGRGGTQMNIGQADLKAWPVPLPSLDEQQRIAEILDKADALRAKRRETIAHLDSLGQSIFHEMFGSPSTNDRGWEVRRLGEMLVSAQYGTSEKSVSVGTIPVLRMGNLTYDGELDVSDLKYLAQESVDLEKYRLMPGDVLFNRTNSAELVGKTAMFSEEGDYTFAGYLIRLRCGPDLNPAYLSAFMNTADTKTKLRSMCKSIVGMANINAKEVQTIDVMLPPLVLQQEFADRLEVVARLRDRYRAQLVELTDLFLSLQDRAFKGEL